MKEGSARIQRIGGRDALVLEPGTTLEYSHPLLSSSKEHTVSGLVYRSGKWQSYEAGSCLSSGMITLHSSTEPLVITNFRYYNWKQEAAERAYDAETDIVRLPVADQQKHGLVVSLSADDFVVNDTVPYLENRGVKGILKPGITSRCERSERKKGISF